MLRAIKGVGAEWTRIRCPRFDLQFFVISIASKKKRRPTRRRQIRFFRAGSRQAGGVM